MNKKLSIKVNQGFYLGDICYCLNGEVYSQIWGKQYNWEQGAYTEPRSNLQFSVVRVSGDGSYITEEGFEFLVDSGTIGVVDMGLSKRSKEELDKHLGLVFDYIGIVDLYYEDNLIKVLFGDKSITIKIEEE